MDSVKMRYNEDNRDHILRYYEAGGEGNTEGIVLTDKQVELDKRWQFAAEKLRERKYNHGRIAQMICGVFKVSRDTAFRDIVNAQFVFAASYPLNKKFIIQNRIEALIIRIEEYKIDGDKLATELAEKNLQRYLEKFPEEIPLRSPKTIIFNVQNNNNTLMLTNMTEEEAMKDIDEFINNMENKDDF